MKKRNIHLVHFTAKPGGIEVLLPGIIHAMKEFIFSVFVIRPFNRGDMNVYRNVDVDIATGHKGLKAYAKIYLYAKKNKNDIFHVFNIGPVFLLVLRIAGVKKLVYSIHGTVYWRNYQQKIVYKFLWFLAMSAKYTITANSEHSAHVFNKKVLNSPVTVLYNPIDTRRFKLSESDQNTNRLKIVYIGRLALGKNLELWIRTAHYILSRDNNIDFEIYGEGPLRDDLQKQIKKLGIENNVKLMGFTDKPEIVYQHADLMLFLSEYESFGNVVVESIMCGTPVICSDIPSMHEIFKENPDFIVKTDANIFGNIYSKINRIDKLKAAASKLSGAFVAKYGHLHHYDTLTKLYNSFS